MIKRYMYPVDLKREVRKACKEICGRVSVCVRRRDAKERKRGKETAVAGNIESVGYKRRGKRGRDEKREKQNLVEGGRDKR